MARGGLGGLGLAIVVGLGVSALGAGCKLGSSSGADTAAPAPPPPPPDPNAPSGDVVRYGAMEGVDTGVGYIRQPVAARKAADYSSGIVATLYPGTGVQRVARYGNFNLVQFTAQGAVQQGWVDAGLAWRVWDAGVTFFDAGVAPIQPVVTTPPTQPTTPPPPVTTTPPPPPPPPPTTTNKPPPPPPTKSTTTSTFKPPPPPPKGH